jgi:prepilin-type processing-associated H-X9-DG protein
MPNSLGYYANSTVTGQRVAAFLCPSDPNAGNLQLLRTADGRMDMLDLSYVASAGTTTSSPNNSKTTNPWATQGSTGLFWWYKSYGIRHVTDGTSNTVAFSEALVSNGTPSNRYPGNSMTGIAGAGGGVGCNGGNAQLYDANQNPAGILAGLQACTTAWNAGKNINEFRGIFWEIGSLGMTMFNTIVPPNSKQYPWGDCRCTGGGYPNDATFANANSLHPGGVNVLMADGSVRFVKDSINQYTWWSMGTRGNGEVISADSY